MANGSLPFPAVNVDARPHVGKHEIIQITRSAVSRVASVGGTGEVRTYRRQVNPLPHCTAFNGTMGARYIRWRMGGANTGNPVVMTGDDERYTVRDGRTTTILVGPQYDTGLIKMGRW